MDGSGADGAESDFIAGEHDAVGLGPEEPFRLVAGAFEGPHLAGELLGCQKSAHLISFFPEESLEVRFRSICLPQLPTAILDRMR